MNKQKTTVAKFEVGDILPLSLTIVVAGIGMAYGLNILSDMKDDMGATSCTARTDDFTGYSTTSDLCLNASNTSQTAPPTDAYFNATSDSITAVAKFPAKLGLIVTVIVAAILIGILVRYLLVR